MKLRLKKAAVQVKKILQINQQTVSEIEKIKLRDSSGESMLQINQKILCESGKIKRSSGKTILQ